MPNRLVKRLVARELTLMPNAEQRLWRTVTRGKYQLTRDRARLQNQVESLLEEAHIKLSSLVLDLLAASARRMLKALAEGETNAAALVALADKQLRATPEQLCDALGAPTVSTDLVDPESGSPLRRTPPSSHETIKASTHRENDPTTPRARLPGRASEFATHQYCGKMISTLHGVRQKGASRTRTPLEDPIRQVLTTSILSRRSFV